MIEVVVLDQKECEIAKAVGEETVSLLLQRDYEQGDRIQIRLKAENFYELDLDPGVRPAVIYAAGETFSFQIPFGEGKLAYPPGSFAGEYHVIRVRRVAKESPDKVRDLSTNPWDIRGESNFYPHCTASVETREESVFAARNTIDGWDQTSGHGFWPYTSWGDNEDPEASIQISFGRKIKAEQVIIHLRSDFPHDNYWHHADLVFDDRLTKPIALQKTGEGQVIELSGIECEKICFCHLQKDEKDPSPFPALTYWKVIGREG